MPPKPKVLHVAPGLRIPAEEFVESATAFIGKRGAGKSGAVKVLEEELFRVGLPFITLDPVGVHWGIKSSADGKSPGLPVLVIGGEHGDLKLDRRAGGEIARAILEANVSCVVDFSQEPKAAYRQFVADFAHELFRLNKSPRVVILEEAPQLVPQKVASDRAVTYEAVERLVSVGRNKGIGIVLVSQRAATINKDVLTQIDNLFVGRLVSPQDRKALGEWVEAWDVRDHFDEFMSRLASLPTRTMYLWSPDTLKKFETVRFKDFTTLHGDHTHLRRIGLLNVQPVPADVSTVIAKLGKTMEKFKAEKVDPVEVLSLRREAEKWRAAYEAEKAKPHGSTQADIAKAMEEAILPFRTDLRNVRASLDEANRRLEIAASAGGPVEVPKAITPKSVSTHGFPEMLAKRPISMPGRFLPGPRTTIPVAYRAPPENGEAKPLVSGERAMLTELVRRMPESLNRNQLGTLAGYSIRSSTFDIYTRNLIKRGLVERNGDLYRATDNGATEIGPVMTFPKNHEQLVAEWSSKLVKGEVEMLRVLIEAYPAVVARADLGERSGYSIESSTFDIYARHLVKLGLAVRDRKFAGEGSDGFRASETLWP